MQPQDQERTNEAFNQFCHLSASRLQFRAQALHRALTGKPMVGEPSGANPLHEATWIAMRMVEIYRESPAELQRDMVGAEARFRDWPIEKTEALLSDLVDLLNDMDQHRKAGRHG